MPFDSLLLALAGAMAVWLSQARGAQWRRWACVLGVVSVPFWFWAGWRAGQWEMLAVSALHALAWLRGVWVYWLAPRPELDAPAGLGTIQLAPGPRR